MNESLNPLIQPDQQGNFGKHGGKISHPQLAKALEEIEQGFRQIIDDPEFIAEMKRLQATYVGRPSPIYHARTLSKNGAQIYLKREDLNHTGAHKINHCIGEVLLAKKLGKKKVIAETGAGRHGVALATAAALLGLECEIHMGVVDIAKEHPNVSRMKILGAKLVPVSAGAGTLKEAVDSAFASYMEQLEDSMFAIGSVVGSAPYPEVVAYFQSIVGHEAKEQFSTQYDGLPDEVIACVGGGSNALGLFNAFIDEPSVALVGVEPAGEGLDKAGRHAATMTKGKFGQMQGFNCYYLQEEDGTPSAVHSIASGLDYPGVGPQHCYLKDVGRGRYETATDQECLEAFLSLSRQEGIIPALESAHAVAYTLRRAKELGSDKRLLVNLSGRGDKDTDFVLSKLTL
ncbi:tryptophan synthase subunit beta [Glaesserella parasuis]|uniref:tryptophan synthase subunit beta n=1 Tax=Glaesserella parasuis TaxID=738 RepID=UPI002719DCD2|nr:tryptophan synthase subunit beta [Glaesserella parasuis]MDO9664972.1 tryptophan synthase subunit beta [Glaesserella parasuis]MDO9767052.1 tryptophan synthase subunit beta [Glaesserella parasuis]MDP0272751.1 tryptophan synthase subunit beta [Glaesserella parasuis]MDP0306822.1 tryptophan synthase subunit beta [Glaesserella parasuis]